MARWGCFLSLIAVALLVAAFGLLFATLFIDDKQVAAGCALLGVGCGLFARPFLDGAIKALAAERN